MSRKLEIERKKKLLAEIMAGNVVKVEEKVDTVDKKEVKKKIKKKKD